MAKLKPKAYTTKD